MPDGINDLTPDERAAVTARMKSIVDSKLKEGWSQDDVRNALQGIAGVAIKDITGRGIARPPSAADLLRQEAQAHPIRSSLLSGFARGAEGLSFGLLPMREALGKATGEPELANAYMGEMDRVANESTGNRIVSGLASLPAILPAARAGGLITKGVRSIPGVTEAVKRLAPIVGSGLGFGAQEAIQPEVTKLVAGRPTEGTMLERGAKGAAMGAAIPAVSQVVGPLASRVLPKSVGEVVGSSAGMAAAEAATGGDPLAGAVIGAAAHPIFQATGIVGERLRPQDASRAAPPELEPIPGSEKHKAWERRQRGEVPTPQPKQEIDVEAKKVAESPEAQAIFGDLKSKGDKEGLKSAVGAVKEIAEERSQKQPEIPSEEMPLSPEQAAKYHETRRQQIRREGREYAAKRRAEMEKPAEDKPQSTSDNALGIVANPEHLKVPKAMAEGARDLSRWLFDATVWDQKRAMKSRLLLGERVSQSVAHELRQRPRLASMLGFRDFDPWFQGIRQWAEDRGGRARLLVGEIESRTKGLTKDQIRDLVMKTERGVRVPGFEAAQRAIHGTARLSARRQVRQRAEVGDVAGEKRGLARETVAQFQQKDAKYLKRLPAQEFAKKRGSLGRILNVLSGGTAFQRGKDTMPVMKLKGIAGGARAVESAVESAQSGRRPLTTEQAAGYRVYTTDGQMKPYKSVVEKKDHIEATTWEGQTERVPKSTIKRVEEPYIYDARTLARTVEETSSIAIQLKVNEMLKDERPDLWREPKGDGDPYWVKAEGAGFGVLEGKEVRADAMELLRLYADPVESGLLHFLATSSALTKMGMVVGRVPGGIAKQIPENILTAMQLGVSPARLVTELPKKIGDLVKFLKGGEPADWIKALQAADLWQESTFTLSAAETGRRGQNYRNIQGSGLKYLRGVKDAAVQDAITRLNALHDKLQKGRIKGGLFYVTAELQRVIADAFYGVNPLQAVTGKSKVAGIRPSGEGAKDAFAMIDNLFRGVIYDDLRGGKLPLHQVALRKMLGQKASGTQFEPEEAVQLLRSVLDPRTMSPATQWLRKYTFLSIPYMLTKHALTGGAVTAPLGTLAMFYTGKVVTAGVIAMLRALGHKVDEDEIEKQRLRLANGDPNRADQFALVPEPPDAKGQYRFIDTRSISMEGGLGVTAFSSFLPGANVQPVENERLPERMLRGAAAMSPVGTMAYELFTSGKSPLTGQQMRRETPAYAAARAATPFIPGAATVANWIADKERDAAAAEAKPARMQTSSTVNRLLRAISGLPVRTSAASGTTEGRSADRFIEFLRRKQEFIKSGGQYHMDEAFPKWPKDGTPEEKAEVREQRKLYRQLNRR